MRKMYFLSCYNYLHESSFFSMVKGGKWIFSSVSLSISSVPDDHDAFVVFPSNLSFLVYGRQKQGGNHDGMRANALY